MLFLFRKLRKSVFSKNRFTKYLVYAVGEIVLVVIGILIAISLNDMNFEKTRSVENEKLLVNLIKDLERDVVRFNKIMEDDINTTSLKTGIKNSKTLLNLSYQKLDSDWVDSLLTIFPHSGLSTLYAETNTYDQLKSTGRLYSIGSDTLRNKITNYYSNVTLNAVYVDRFNKMMIDWILKLDFLRNLKLDKVHDPNFNLINYPWLFDSKSPELQTYRDVMDRVGNFQQRSYKKFILLSDNASTLIKDIEKELAEDALK